jgi:hypothetical protein
LSAAHAMHLIDTYPALYRLAWRARHVLEKRWRIRAKDKARAHLRDGKPLKLESYTIKAIEPFELDGFCVGDGWAAILGRLSAKLAAADPNVYAVQIKEKYGTLCFYTEGDTPKLAHANYVARTAAREESEHTCEICGEPGKLRESRTHWFSVRCERCYRADLRWAKRTKR